MPVVVVAVVVVIDCRMVLYARPTEANVIDGAAVAALSSLVSPGSQSVSQSGERRP